jgi:putative cell wall-binding protein
VDNRSVTTVAVATVLLLVALMAPVAGAEGVDVAVETRSDRIDGLATDPGAPASFAAARDASRASAPTATAIPFSMLGFSVPGGPAGLWLRTSDDGEAWTAWEQAAWHDEEGPDEGTPEGERSAGRTVSAPVWVGEARWLQVRTAGGLAPEDVSVYLIDSVGLHRNIAQRALDAVRAAWGGEGRAAAAVVDQPAILTRQQWGADESRRSGNPSYARGLKAAYVHHTAGGGSANSYSEAQVAGLIRGFYEYHTGFQGWSDIGYNFLVDRFGRIWEGRAGGIDRAVIGAHAAGFNTGTVGVAVIGDFEGVNPSPAAVEAVARLVSWKFDVHHVDVGAPVTLTSGGGSSNRYPSGTQVTLSSVNGHRDTGWTACPGLLYTHLPTIRNRAAALASDMFVQPSASPSTILLEIGSTPPAVTFSTGLKPAGAWSLQVRGPGGGVAHSASGSGSSATSTWQPPQDAGPGSYTYTFQASGRRGATGTVTIGELLLDRVGASNDPVNGAIDIARAAFPAAGSAGHAVITRSDVFADAMAGGPLAGTHGPLLLTGSGGLDARVRTELERVLAPGGTVYVLGGTQALSPEVVDDLQRTWPVERIGGAERTATAASVAARVLARSGSSTVMLARSEAPAGVQPWADALAGGAYGAKAGVPVLLTPGTALTAATRDALAGVTRTIVLGGTLAISDEVAGEVPDPVRVSGQDRSGTAAAIAERLWGRTTGRDGDLLILGPGYREGAWTMTLSAAPLAARNDAPLLLANAGTLPPETRRHLERLDYGGARQASGWVVGSTSAVGDAVVGEVSRFLR